MTTNIAAVKQAPPATSPAVAKASTPQDSVLGHPHLITVEKLLVHKYEDTAILLRKADKVALEIIHNELREGEFVQVVRPGRYHLHFPKLRLDAGQLRCSVISSEIYRAIRDLNPTAIRLDTSEATTPAPVSNKGAANSGRPLASAPRPTPLDPHRAKAEEDRRIASQAIAAMSRSGASLSEELLDSPLGQLLDREIQVERIPIWNVKTRLIVGHEITPIRNGEPFLPSDQVFHNSRLEQADARALTDTIVYQRACQVLREQMIEGAKGLVICPVHASTLSFTKYVRAFIGAGSGLPSEAQRFLVFLIKDFAMPISRINVREIAGYLRARCRSLIAETAIETEKLSPAFKEFAFHGLRAMLTNTFASEARLLKQFSAFVDKCEREGLQPSIADLETPSLTIGALTAGFAYLSGSSINRGTGGRGRIQDFDIDELFL